MTTEADLCAEVGLVIFPDCQLSAVYGLTDVFRIAGEMSAARAEGGAAHAVRVSHWQLSPDGSDVVCSYDSHPGLPHRLTYLITPPSLIVPSRMQPMGRLTDWLAGRHAAGATLVSVCAGAFLVAETGLLDGRTATTHWAFAAELARRYPSIRVDSSRMVIDDGDIVTAGGILAWTDLGLTLVARHLGPTVMLDTARFLLIDPPGRLQQPYGGFVDRRDHGDAAILKAQLWMHGNGAREHAIPELAEISGLGERTFQRRFQKATGMKATEYAQQIRIERAREALELTRKPVEQVAWDVGYGDPSAFRRIFQRITGLAPADYRRRFGLMQREAAGPAGGATA
ncbi:MAG: GlxA family transcriptional regulator [Bosea sp.]|nr:GlxA family transcriptional regulator [Bosea sp. (in: a-proteobacteria)]